MGLNNTEEYQKALEAAFRLLGFKMRTEQELTQRLSQKGFSPEVVQAVIKRLQELDYLNDTTFVENYIKSKSKTVGIRRLQYDLTKKGINKDEVEQGLTQWYTQEQELAAACALVDKLWRQAEKKNNFQEDRELKIKETRRIVNKLLMRGFSYNAAEAALRQKKLADLCD